MIALDKWTNWIPYELRDKAAQRLTDEFNEQIGFFGDVAGMTSAAEPERVCIDELYFKEHNETMPRIWQTTGSCLLGSSLIRMADGLEKRIDAVEVGDLVVSHKGIARKVTGVSRKKSWEDVTKFHVRGWAGNLVCTENHIVPVLEFGPNHLVWKHAKDIQEGHNLLVVNEGFTGLSPSADRFAHPVERVESLGQTSETVYDLEVAVDHTFIADSFVVHNCVGAGGANCYLKMMYADRKFRGDNDDVTMPFFLATYGKGREIAGMRGRGSGSFGAAQAKACQPEHFGMMRADDERVPQAQIKDGIWLKYDSRTELEWSYAPRWPINESDLKPDAEDFGVEKVTRIRSADEAKQALAQGYPLTHASMFGSRPSVKGDVLIGPWNGRWAHQMSCDGYWDHPDHGLLFANDNQWGPRAHGECPTFSKWGVHGSFWIPEADYDSICKRGEVIAHGNGGFPGRDFVWNFAFLLRSRNNEALAANTGPRVSLGHCA